MSEKIEHTAGPWHWRDSDPASGEQILIDCGDPAQPHTVGLITIVNNYARFMSATTQQEQCDRDTRANADLIALAPTAPHSCSVPRCVGDLNRRKLELLEEMKDVLLSLRERSEFGSGPCWCPEPPGWDHRPERSYKHDESCIQARRVVARYKELEGKHESHG